MTDPTGTVPPLCWCGSVEAQTVHHESWGHQFSTVLPVPPLSPEEEARPTYPKWIGLGGWQAGVKGYYGIAELITSPGKVERRVKCEHTHKSHLEGRACGQRIAAIAEARRQEDRA